MRMGSAAGTQSYPSLVIIRIIREGTLLKIRAGKQRSALIAEVVVRDVLRHRFLLI